MAEISLQSRSTTLPALEWNRPSDVEEPEPETGLGFFDSSDGPLPHKLPLPPLRPPYDPARFTPIPPPARSAPGSLGGLRREKSDARSIQYGGFTAVRNGI
jgi:hypothetical protein